MYKTKEMPFFESEDLSIYESERKWLNQEPNEALYYINGKSIVKRDGGETLFTELSEDEKEFFVFGSSVEDEYLRTAAELSDADREIMFQLDELNREISSRGIFAVSLLKENNTIYAVIHAIKHSANTYFQIPVPDLKKMDEKHVDELLSFNEERTLDNPYGIQFEGDQMLAY